MRAHDAKSTEIGDYSNVLFYINQLLLPFFNQSSNMLGYPFLLGDFSVTPSPLCTRKKLLCAPDKYLNSWELCYPRKGDKGLRFSVTNVEYYRGKEIKTIHFLVDERIKDQSKKIAEKKAKYTMPVSVSGEVRGVGRLLYNHWQGKIADKAVRVWLEQKDIETQEYDEIRTNDFKRPDPWDLRVKSSGLELEVRSSCLSRSNHTLEHVANHYKILGPYTIPGFKESEKSKYAHVQVIYPYTQASLNQRLKSGMEIEGYAVGWATRENLFKEGFDWHWGATLYRAILIKDGELMSELVNFLKKKI